MSVPLAMYEKLRDQYDGLVREVLAMKREGFTPAATDYRPAEMPELPSAVLAAIAAIATGDEALGRTLTDAAWTLHRGGLEPEAIAQRILDGEPAEL